MKIQLEFASWAELENFLDGRRMPKAPAERVRQAFDHAPLVYGSETPLRDIKEMSERTKNCFLAEGMTTLGQVSKLNDEEMLKIPNLGKKSWAETMGILRASRALWVDSI